MYVAKKQENSKDKIVWDGNPESLVRTITASKSGKYPLLRGIALYEATFFNSQQVKELVSELEAFKQTLSCKEDVAGGVIVVVGTYIAYTL